MLELEEPWESVRRYLSRQKEDDYQAPQSALESFVKNYYPDAPDKEITKLFRKREELTRGSPRDFRIGAQKICPNWRLKIEYVLNEEEQK